MTSLYANTTVVVADIMISFKTIENNRQDKRNLNVKLICENDQPSRKLKKIRDRYNIYSTYNMNQ